MNMLDSKCYQCGTRILVSQAASKDPLSHICVQCSSMDDDDSELWNQFSITDPDDEFDFETEEEEEFERISDEEYHQILRDLGLE